MNQSSREQIEARITALLLGELPTEEAELLRFTISQDAALKQLHDELVSTIVIVREVAKNPAGASDEKTVPPKISDERREKLLAHFKTPRKQEPLFWLKPIKIPSLISALAVVALVALVAAMFLPALASSKKKAQKISAANVAKQQALEREYAKSDNLHANSASRDQSDTALAVAGDFPAASAAMPAVVTVSPAPIVAPPPVAIVLPSAEPSEPITPTTGLLRDVDNAGVISHGTVGYVNTKPMPAEVPANANSVSGFSSGSFASAVKTDAPQPPAENFALGVSSVTMRVYGEGKASGQSVKNYFSSAAGGEIAAAKPSAGDQLATRERSRFGGAGGGGAGGPSSTDGFALARNDSSVNRSLAENAPKILGEEMRRKAPAGAADATVAFDFAASEPPEKDLALAVNGAASANLESQKLKAENSGRLLTSGLRDGDSLVAGNKFYRQPTRERLDSNGSIAPASAAPAMPVASAGTFNFATSDLAKRAEEPKLMDKSVNGPLALGDAPKDSFKTGLAKEDAGGLRYLIATNAVMAGNIDVVAELDKPIRHTSLPAPIPQPEFLTRENNFSTFSLNVSDVSFKLAAASLERGQMPDAASIRSEEFINAFDYRDPEAAAGQPLAFASERARYPFAQNRELLRFSVKTAAAGRPAGCALNLVLLLDNSGSMERADRVAIIREALRVLATQLQPQDTVSVVTFARTARLWADGLPGDKAGETLAQVGGITPEGGTNLEEAMRLAYETARRHYLANGLNRVVLLTDGAANLGDVNPADLKQKVEAQRKQGIALDCFGIGQQDYNDELLEQLSSNGDGRYAFLNSPEDASKEFAAKLAGALQIAASDVKVQVEFNPQRVISYRQIGYAKHQLTKEQFRDNTVDAAEIAAQEAGNALYTVETKADGIGPIATVRVRYKVPSTTDYRERSWAVAYTGNALALEQSSAAMRLAATASAFSEWLAASPFAQEVTPDELLKTLSGVPQIYGADERPKKLEWMIRQAKSLSGK